MVTIDWWASPRGLRVIFVSSAAIASVIDYILLTNLLT
jgi:hypothetical protein